VDPILECKNKYEILIISHAGPLHEDAPFSVSAVQICEAEAKQPNLSQ
jgi:hypothetical protein